MNTALKTDAFTAEDYLHWELGNETRHEFVAGDVYAMAGSSAEHNQIVTNLAGHLFPKLRNGPSPMYMADFKVRIRLGHDDCFYYPDLVIICGPVAPKEYYTESPRIIVEILSPST